MPKQILLYILAFCCFECDSATTLRESMEEIKYGKGVSDSKDMIERMDEIIKRLDGFEKNISDGDEIIKKVDSIAERFNGFEKEMAAEKSVLREKIKRDDAQKLLFADVPVGTILPFAGTNFDDLVGIGWLPCDGRIVSQAAYPSLYEVIGTRYNIGSLNKETHFQVPDFRGRFLLGSGQGKGLTARTVGEYLGKERHSLTVDEMPRHSHGVSDPGHSHALSYYYRWDGYYSGSENQFMRFGRGSSVTTNNRKTRISIKGAGASEPHAIIPPSSVVSYIIKAPKAHAGPTPWPSADNLLGFWPLSALHQTEDISPNKVPAVSNLQSMSFVSGPFGDSDTAAVMGGKIETSGIETGNSFTLSFFLKCQNVSGTAGVFEFSDRYQTPKAFQVRRLNRTTMEVSSNGVSIGFYHVLQPQDAWTFLAFTFDALSAMFTVYGKHGVVIPPTFQPHILAGNSFNNDGFRVGHTSRWNETLSEDDYISCVMVYTKALTALEIKQAYDSCRIILGSVPCGSPKLPISAIPSATSVTSIPKQGQFPFIASLRINSTHICSANIIDEYWLVTSAQCFQQSSDPSFYQIYVGEYDLDLNEAFTQQRSCTKIIVSGSDSRRDIALIEVDAAIDFTSDYVNNVCLLSDYNVNELVLDTTQFVFGWGINGRQPFVSETVARYVPGQMMTNNQCKEAWGSGVYNSNNDVCFISLSNDKDVPCHMDEGSPLLVQLYGSPETGKKNHLVAVGLYYTRSVNCSLSKPALFTNVAKFSSWIAENIACAIPGSYYPESCSQQSL